MTLNSSLKQLVPIKLAEILGVQETLKQFPEALVYVERQISAYRHAGHVIEVQRLGKPIHTVDKQARADGLISSSKCHRGALRIGVICQL